MPNPGVLDWLSHLPSTYSLSESSQRVDESELSTLQHLKALELSDDGILIQELAGLRDTPPSLGHLLRTMRLVSRGRGVIDVADQLAFQGPSHPGCLEIGEDTACFSANRSLYGHVPDQGSVLGILDAAIECQQNLHPQTTWDIQVHGPLLQLALHKPSFLPFSHFINYMPCSTASILSEYLPPFAPSKNIDFCVYFEPALEPALNPTQSATATLFAIEAARDRLANQAISHSDYYALRQRPLGFGIATEKMGEGWDDAALRIGVWQAAHWNLLRKVVQSDKAKFNPARLPDFLPGIIIHGHEWYFIVTTRETSQMILWLKLAIGSTSSVMGIYQIILGLQVLRKWAQDEYWPIVRDAISGWC